MANEELFDIYDEQLAHLGTATRAETHANGYWHRSFHCWLVRRSEGHLMVLFQQRHADKDTNPSCYDITAAGHLTAGESVEDAVRELEEELGVAVRFEELTPLGQVREVCEGEVNGKPFIDREVSDVFGLACELSLAELRLQPDEVRGVYEAELGELLVLFEGRAESVDVSGVELRDGMLEAVAGRRVRAEEFVPRELSYYVDVLVKLRELF